MSNLISRKALFENKANFFEYLLNTDKGISKQYINDKGWVAMPCSGYLYSIEAEWLSDAIHRLGSNSYYQYLFYDDRLEETLQFNNNSSNINSSDLNYSYCHTIITNENVDFIYYRHEWGLYHMFAGTPDFVYSCIRCSRRISKKMFLEYCFNDAESPADYEKCKRAWFLYQGDDLEN